MTRTKALVVLAMCIVLFCGLGAWSGVYVLGQIQHGRVADGEITCAVLSGVTEQGREVIIGATGGKDTPFLRQLERLGYPPLRVRRVRAERAATAYVDGIAAKVVQAVGRKGLSLVKHDGTIDCRAFLRLTNS